MSEKLISADALYQEVQESREDNRQTESMARAMHRYLHNHFLTMIYHAPAVDAVEVRHGKWYLLDECSNAGVYCSVCGKKVYKENYANQNLKSPYCPNCGAKMDGKGEE